MIFGYARVSKEDQNLDMQISALQDAGVDRIFKDVCSGSIYHRPELQKLLQILRPGDVVKIWKFDRLTRSIKDLICLLDQIHQHGAKWVSITEGLDSSNPAALMTIHMVGILAENERKNIVERVKAGLKKARENNVIVGRPNKLSHKQIEIIRETYIKEEMSIKELAKKFDVSYSTVYRMVNNQKNPLLGM